VPPTLAGPLDRAVRGLFGASWGRARGWIEAGKVRVSGAVVTEATARVAAGDTVALDERAPGSGARSRRAELDDRDVVYVDAQVIVVAKPPGVSTVPHEASDERDTLEARVRAWLERRGKAGKGGRSAGGRPSGGRSGGGRPSGGRPGGRPPLGVVHRLDKETSGLVVFTRTWMAKQRLAAQFRQHTVHRRYLAVAHGDVRTRTIRSFLIEDRGDGLRGSARGTPGAGGREAITHVERVEALTGATLVACRLETGRTHQIRIHLSEAGHPLVGERVYVRGFAGPLIEAPRLMLHAAELGFVHPATEREVRWELPLPDDMRAVVERLRHRG
jgi:23S rRNA pseudouridine1911/1915/1917 synthase